MRKTLIASLVVAGLVGAPAIASAKSSKPAVHKVEKQKTKKAAPKTN